MAVVEVVESLVLMVSMDRHNKLHCVWPASDGSEANGDIDANSIM